MMRVVNGKLMAVCRNCGKIIRVDKPLFGSVHVCTTEEEQKLYGTQIAHLADLAEKELESAR